MESARAAIVTGASSGIGLAVARMLGEDGYAVTLVARRPEKLEAAYEQLRDEGLEVQHVAGNVGEEEDVIRAVAAHRDAYGRLDVLMNNAGRRDRRADRRAGHAAHGHPAEHEPARDPALLPRGLAMLKAAGAEHRNALVVNTASIAGKKGQAWLWIYSATKFGVVGFTQAMNQELSEHGIKSTALCPGFVDTPMTDFVKDQIGAEAMIQTSTSSPPCGCCWPSRRAASCRRSSSSDPRAGSLT